MKKEVLKRFEAAQEDDRYENGHSYSGGIGMAAGLKFEDQTFYDEDLAEDWLQEHCKKWEEAKAVMLKTPSEWVYLIGAWCSS